MICFSAVTHGEGSHHKQHHTRPSHPYFTHTHTHSHALPHTTRITSRPYIFFFFFFYLLSSCSPVRVATVGKSVYGSLNPPHNLFFLLPLPLLQYFFLPSPNKRYRISSGPDAGYRKSRSLPIKPIFLLSGSSRNQRSRRRTGGWVGEFLLFIIFYFFLSIFL